MNLMVLDLRLKHQIKKLFSLLVFVCLNYRIMILFLGVVVEVDYFEYFVEVDFEYFEYFVEEDFEYFEYFVEADFAELLV